MKTSTLIAYISLIVLGFGMFLYLDYINIMLSYDDAYTMAMIQHPMNEIWNITSSDIHPPLYYMLLKVYSFVCGSSIFSVRLFSNLGVLATFLFAAYSLRKRFGDQVALVFIALLLVFPVTQFLATEIRMYSWALFFLLASAMYAHDCYIKSRFVDWTKFLVLALCAAYIHYYTLLSVGMIVLTLFIVISCRKKEARKAFFITAGLFTLAYLPWAIHLCTQLGGIGHLFWIKPIILEDIYYHLYYFYSIKKDWLPFSNPIKTVLMLGAALILLLQLILVVRIFIKSVKEKSKIETIALFAFLAFFMPVLIGFLVSILVKPVIEPRYMTCSLGLLIFSLAIVMVQSCNTKVLKTITIALFSLLTLYGGMRYYASVRYYKQERWAYNKMNLFIAKEKAEPHVFLADCFETAALARLQALYPHERSYILVPQEWGYSFAPFAFKKVHHEQSFFTHFILVQKIHSEGGPLGNRFREAMQQNFVITDSINALDMVLYKMESKAHIEKNKD